MVGAVDGWCNDWLVQWMDGVVFVIHFISWLNFVKRRKILLETLTTANGRDETRC